MHGLSTYTGIVTFTSLIQSRVPEDLRRRALAGFDMLWQSGWLLSLLGGGILANTLGIQAVYLLGGLLLLTAAAVGPHATRTDRAPQAGTHDPGASNAEVGASDEGSANGTALTMPAPAARRGTRRSGRLGGVVQHWAAVDESLPFHDC